VINAATGTGSNAAGSFGDPLSLDPNGYAYDLATAIDYDPAFSGGDNRNYPYTSMVGSFPANGYGLPRNTPMTFRVNGKSVSQFLSV
jgi:hypothetical protein